MSNIKFEKGRFLFEFQRLIIEGTILDISEKAVKIKWAEGVTEWVLKEKFKSQYYNEPEYQIIEKL